MLAFADQERFHPLAVEAYLARCDLFERAGGWRGWLRRADRVTAAWDERAGAEGPGDAAETGARRARVLDGFDGRCFLRLLDPAARKARRAGGKGPGAAFPWIGAIVLAVLAGLASGAAAWLSLVWPARLLLGLLGVVVAFMVYGWVRARHGADRAMVAFLGLVSAVPLIALGRAASSGGRWLGKAGIAAVLLGLALQFWARNSLSPRAAAGLKRLSVVPMVLCVIWALASWCLGPAAGVAITGLGMVVLVLVVSDDLVAAGMAVLSSLRREAGEQAVAIEQELRDGSERGAYTCYGRVARHPGGTRLALQYFYFYAFNDWRGQGGLNFHEGDWEWATVLLDRQGDAWQPRELVLSQHHRPGRRPWVEVERTPAGHPVVYVAAGSHANYFAPRKLGLPDLVGRSWFAALLAFVFDSRRASLQAADDGVEVSSRWLGRRAEARSEHPATADDPNGRGLVIGAEAPGSAGERRPTAPWRLVVLDGSQRWVEYRGLWGQRLLLRNESGPPGPKWEREENLRRGEQARGRCRRGWQDPWG